MSDVIENPPQVEIHAEEALPAEPKRRNVLVVALVVVVILGVAATTFVGHKLQNNGSLLSEELIDTAQLSGKIDSLDLRLKQVEKSLAQLDQPYKQAGAEKSDDLKEASSQDIDKLKAGLAGLSGALGMLQAELEKTTKAQSENNHNAQAGISTLLGYVLLQRAALSGHPFEKERQDFRRVSEGDVVLVDALLKLENVALTGVATPQSLLKEWGKVSNEAQGALRKASAQTWIDRIVVALEGLVSIRSLTPKGDSPLSFGAISLDLEAGSLAAAHEKVVALPPEVQEVIAPWRKKLEDRASVESSLNAMAAHLLTRGTEPASPTTVPSQAEETK